MIWYTGFEGPILGRGKSCFKDGAVVGLHRGTLEWQALVVGTKLYRVGAGMERGRVTSLRCNCPYAKEGTSPATSAKICTTQPSAPIRPSSSVSPVHRNPKPLPPHRLNRPK